MGVVLSAMVSVVTMKTATAEDEGLPIVFLDIDDVLCLNNPYGGFDALEAVKGRHADPDTVLREIVAAKVSARERAQGDGWPTALCHQLNLATGVLP